MDEIKVDLDAVRRQWGGQASTVAKSKANRRGVERSVRKSSDFWTGRSAQWNIRMTPELKADVQAFVAEHEGMSIAEFFETAALELMGKKRGKNRAASE